MKPEKTKPEVESGKIITEPRNSVFFICERCGHIYEDTTNLPLKCDGCGACLLCEN